MLPFYGRWMAVGQTEGGCVCSHGAHQDARPLDRLCRSPFPVPGRNYDALIHTSTEVAS